MARINSDFWDVLTGGRVVLMDGAMGTELAAAGMNFEGGEHCTVWNRTRPEAVTRVHRAYLNAGAEVLLTNTFRFHLGEDSGPAALALARAAAPDHWVLGDIGPRDDGRYADCLAELEGADGYLVETLSASDLDPVMSLPRETDRPVLLSLTFREGDIGPALGELARRAEGAGFAGLGVNCGLEIDVPACAAALREYRNGTGLPLFARPNAGWRRHRSPEEMAAGVGGLIEAGACLIGGCCGTTPAHIAAMGRAIRGSRR